MRELPTKTSGVVSVRPRDGRQPLGVDVTRSVGARSFRSAEWVPHAYCRSFSGSRQCASVRGSHGRPSGVWSGEVSSRSTIASRRMWLRGLNKMSRNGLKAGRKIRRCNPPERESGCKLARWLTPRTRPNGSIGRCRVPTYFVSTTSARSARAGSPSRNTAPTSSSGGETGRFRPRSNRWYGATRLASRSSPSGDEPRRDTGAGYRGSTPPDDEDSESDQPYSGPPSNGSR